VKPRNFGGKMRLIGWRNGGAAGAHGVTLRLVGDAFLAQQRNQPLDGFRAGGNALHLGTDSRGARDEGFNEGSGFEKGAHKTSTSFRAVVRRQR
jgi:hypothetical protein